MCDIRLSQERDSKIAEAPRAASLVYKKANEDMEECLKLRVRAFSPGPPSLLRLGGFKVF